MRLIQGPRGTRRLLLSWTPDRAADGALDVILGLAAASSTASPLGAAGVMAAAFTPQLVVTLIGGAVGERVGPLRLVRLTFGVRIMLLLFLAAAMGTGWAWLGVAVLGGLLGVLDGFHFPAFEAVATLLSPADDDVAQGQVQSAMDGAADVAKLAIVPVVGALLAWGPQAPLVLLAGALALSWITLKELGPHLRAVQPAEVESGGSLLAEVREGLVAAARIPRMPLMLTIYATANLLTAPAVMLGLPVVARERGWSGMTYALVFGSFAAGGVLGSLAINQLRASIQRSLSVALACESLSAIGVVVLVVSAAPLAAGAGGLLAGLLGGISGGILGGDIRAATPDGLVSRMAALRVTCVYALIPAGYVVWGVLAERMSPTTAGAAMAVVMAALATAALVHVVTQKNPTA